MAYLLKTGIVDARRLNVDNIRAVEMWCGGSIKGTSLPPEDRCIDVQTSYGEVRADIGDWIVHLYGDLYIKLDDIDFNKVFKVESA